MAVATVGDRRLRARPATSDRRALMPSAVVVDRADRCRATTPSVPLLLTNTEKPAAARQAGDRRFTVDFREHVRELGVQRRARCRAVVWPEAACVASVARRSSSFEMLLSAPSLICRSDRPSLALRMPWFRTATVRTVAVRHREAGRVVTRVVDAEAARQAGQGLCGGRCWSSQVRLRVDRGDVGDD